MTLDMLVQVVPDAHPDFVTLVAALLIDSGDEAQMRVLLPALSHLFHRKRAAALQQDWQTYADAVEEEADVLEKMFSV